MNYNQKSIPDYLTDYLDYLEIEKGLSSKTQENYSRFLHKFFTWLSHNNLKNLKPKELNVDHISKYRIFLARYTDPKLNQPLKKSTQNYYLIALRGLLEFFLEKNIDCLAPGKIKLARQKKDKDIKFLTLDQLKKLLDAPNTKTRIGLRDKVILETLFSTGLRVNELTMLDREQFQIREITDMEISVMGKGNRVRTVYFSKRVIDYMKKYLDNRGDLDKALFINYKPGAQKSDESRRLTTRSIENIVKKYVTIAGLPIMASPHTLRHSFATDLLQQGVDLRLVQEFLGHANIATTQIYTHVTNKQLRDVHRKFHGGKDI